MEKRICSVETKPCKRYERYHISLQHTNISYLGVVYEVDIFKIFRRGRRSVKNVASFYPRSWWRLLYKIHVISKSRHGSNREPQWAACIPPAVR
jgi:hypothetical protein